MYCLNCGQPRTSDIYECEFCNHNPQTNALAHMLSMQTPKVCPVCFTKNPIHAKYCKDCGHFLSEKDIKRASGSLPNSTAVLVLGILSIFTCWTWGIFGLIFGIIALYLFSSSDKIYKENPDSYFVGSYKNLKAGRICAIIGIVLSAIYLLFVGSSAIYLLFAGSVFKKIFF